MSFKNFDFLEISLEGRHLVEASAGTGKTFNIAMLYLRLLVEKKYLPSQILVVTFTEAATKELRDRVRKKIAEAVDFFGQKKSDPLLHKWQQLLQKKKISNDDASRLLRQALLAFDQAAISTIHSFCQRALSENAFESGSLYSTEMGTSDDELLQAAVEDYWRKKCYGHDSDNLHAFVRELLLANANFSVSKLVNFSKIILSNIAAKIEPEPRPLSADSDLVIRVADCQQKIASKSAELKEIWKVESGVIENLIKNANLYKKPYGDKDSLISYMHDLLMENKLRLPQEIIQIFSFSYLQSKLKSGGTIEQHDFFVQCDELYHLLLEEIHLQQEAREMIQADLLFFVQNQLRQLKKNANLRVFNDLLLDLKNALAMPGSILPDKLRQKFPVALVDEFQDTDPVQYEIFDRIYLSGQAEASLYLIGDPKQAIYGFRGADIFAYLQAQQTGNQGKYTMGENWRSTPALLAAIEAVFSPAENRPFVLEGIDFVRVKAGDKKVENEFSAGQMNQGALQFWHIGGEKTSISELNGFLLPSAIASEISLLMKEAKINTGSGQRHLNFGDIAILVRSHHQAIPLKNKLKVAGIPFVSGSTGKIFQSLEAQELKLFLAALADPAKPGKLKAALACNLWGLTADQLQNEQVHGSKIRDYAELWQQKGFMAMMRRFMAEQKLRQRILALPVGERRLTNYLHLFELVEEAIGEEQLGLHKTLHWLEQKLEDSGETEDEMRLESDEDAVKIVTIHASKGLEYPVVFCPYLFKNVDKFQLPVSYHRPQDKQLVVTYSDTDKNIDIIKDQFQTESLAENVRLMYVALTRAKYRCYMAWGAIDRVTSAAPGHLLDTARNHPAEYYRERLRPAGEAIQIENLAELAEAALQAAPVPAKPDKDKEEYFLPEAPAAASDDHWRISSYTALSSNQPSHEHWSEYFSEEDSGEKDEKTSGCPDASFSARGALAGDFLHKVLDQMFRLLARSSQQQVSHAENLRALFDPADNRLANIINYHLECFGISQNENSAVRNLLKPVFFNIMPAISAGSFSLAELAGGQWLSEMDFYFPLKKLQTEKLTALFRQYYPQDDNLAELKFEQIEGFLTGSIDLVFAHDEKYYIIDWKSNNLKNDKNYQNNSEVMQKTMSDHLYRLQYLVYSVALDNYLRWRLQTAYDYEQHFGGVYYIFLRGRCHGDNHGVFSDRPPAELIAQMRALLLPPA